VFRWVIKDELARGPRPRSGKHWTGQVHQATVNRWIRCAKKRYGIKSVICLLDEEQLRLYEQLPLDLISYYRRSGLKVEHVPVKNGVRMFSRKQRKKVWKAYKQLPKPTVIHCSAGIGRTGKAISHIKRRMKAKS